MYDVSFSFSFANAFVQVVNYPNHWWFHAFWCLEMYKWRYTLEKRWKYFNAALEQLSETELENFYFSLTSLTSYFLRYFSFYCDIVTNILSQLNRMILVVRWSFLIGWNSCNISCWYHWLLFFSFFLILHEACYSFFFLILLCREFIYLDDLFEYFQYCDKTNS